MASPKAGADTAPARPLPPIKVAKFKEVGVLLERLVEENTDLFVTAGQNFRERHYAGTERPLSPVEVAQIATCMGKTLEEATEDIEAAGMRAQDEPDPMQVLLVMGINTASVWMDGLLAIVALIEMDDERFKAAREAQALRTAIEADVARMEDGDVAEMRERASAAMDHLAAQSGVDSGKAWGVLGRSVWQALEQAAEHLRTIPSTSSLIASQASTTGDAT